MQRLPSSATESRAHALGHFAVIGRLGWPAYSEGGASGAVAPRRQAAQQEPQVASTGLETRGRDLGTAWSNAQEALSRVAAPEALAELIMAKLGGVAGQQFKPASVASQRLRKKKVAP